MPASIENTGAPLLQAPRALHLSDSRINVLKWAASVVQIMGYSATAFGLAPLNIYLFLVGLIGWFAVGWFWRDKAIMLIHLVALAAMAVGLISG